MGIFTALITLPLAPVRGVAWVAAQVADEVERELHDPARLRGELLRLELDHDAGVVDDTEYEARSEELLQRIAAASRIPDRQRLQTEVSNG